MIRHIHARASPVSSWVILASSLISFCGVVLAACIQTIWPAKPFIARNLFPEPSPLPVSQAYFVGQIQPCEDAVEARLASGLSNAEAEPVAITPTAYVPQPERGSEASVAETQPTTAPLAAAVENRISPWIYLQTKTASGLDSSAKQPAKKGFTWKTFSSLFKRN